ncbi:T9SS type A sorting domain-containing protein [Candidatus Nomurabacteria bacterium]|nr:MAG: T9SS type A sorting domain-containing protein [Candidatus Nomurabacteria bacterium]
MICIFAMTVQISFAQEAAFTVSKANPCMKQDSVIFTDQSTGDITEWYWSFGGGTPYSHYGQTPPKIHFDWAGSHQVWLTITTSDGYQHQTSQYINVSELPAAMLDQNNLSNNCPGTEVTLSSSQTMEKFEWFKEDSLISSGLVKTISVTETGEYELYVTDANGCRSQYGDDIYVPYYQEMIVIMDGWGPTGGMENGELSNCYSSPGSLNAQVYNAWAQPLTFVWNGIDTTYYSNYTPTGTGDYSVQVTDQNGCKAKSETVHVTTHPTPIIAINALNGTSACYGDSLLLTVPNSWSSYQWNYGSTNSVMYAMWSGNYSVTVTDMYGCIGMDNIDLNFMQPPQEPNIFPGDGCTLATDGIDGVQQWYVNNVAIANSDTPYLFINTSGFYTVEVTNTNGCISERSNPFWANCSVTGILELQPTIEFMVYPNPATDVINISLPISDDYTVELINMVGQHVFDLQNQQGLVNVHRPNIPPGQYLLKVSDKDGINTVQQVIFN